MTTLTIAGSVLLQGMTDDEPLDDPAEGARRVEGRDLHQLDRVTPESLAALARIHDRTRSALASQAARTGSRPTRG